MNTQNTAPEGGVTAPASTMNHPAVIWLRDTFLPSVGGNKSEAHRQLGISPKTQTALITGTYQGDREGQLAKLEEQMNRISGQYRPETSQDLAHIPTQMMRRIWNACEASKRAHLLNFVYGKSQIGKTTAAESYKAKFPETTIFFRMPTRTTLYSMLYELTAAVGQRMRYSAAATLRALKEALTPRHLIIADEVHLALANKNGLDALDALRELFDCCGCGLVLIVTDIGAKELISGPYSERIKQLERRGEWEMLPDDPYNADIEAIYRAYGLGEPDAETRKLLRAMGRESCLGQFIHRMKFAAVVAQQERRPLTWADFLDAASRMGRRPE